MPEANLVEVLLQPLLPGHQRGLLTPNLGQLEAHLAPDRPELSAYLLQLALVVTGHPLVDLRLDLVTPFACSVQ